MLKNASFWRFYLLTVEKLDIIIHKKDVFCLIYISFCKKEVFYQKRCIAKKRKDIYTKETSPGKQA